MKKKVVTGIVIVIGIVAVVVLMGVLKNKNRNSTAAVPAETAVVEGSGAFPEAGQSPEQRPAATDSPQPAAEVSRVETVTAKPVSGIAFGPLQLVSAFDLEELRRTGLPLIIDFGADTCIPCKEMAPVLVDLHDSLQGKAIIRFVDVWKYRGLSNGYPIQVIPTQVFFDATGNPFDPDESLGIPFTQYSNRDNNELVFTTHEGGLTKPQLISILAAMGMKKLINS